MPTWNLGNLMSYATRRIGHRSDLALSDVSFWANQAQLDFVYDVPELLSDKEYYFSVSSGDSRVALPADFMEPIVLSFQTTADSSSKTLRPISPEFADAQGYYPVAEPKGYFIYGGEIQLWPSADSSALTTDASSGRSYLLRYTATPSDMVSLTSVPSVATEHRYGILLRLEAHLHQLVGNYEEATLAEAQYVGYVSKLRDAITKRQKDRTRYALSLPLGSGRRLTDDPDGDYRFLRY